MFKIVMLVSAGVGFVAAYSFAKIVMSEIGIMELYPQLPEEFVIAAHRQFLKDIFTAKVQLPTNPTDAQIQDYFERHYLAKM